MHYLFFCGDGLIAFFLSNLGIFLQDEIHVYMYNHDCTTSNNNKADKNRTLCAIIRSRKGLLDNILWLVVNKVM